MREKKVAPNEVPEASCGLREAWSQLELHLPIVTAQNVRSAAVLQFPTSSRPVSSQEDALRRLLHFASQLPGGRLSTK